MRQLLPVLAAAAAIAVGALALGVGAAPAEVAAQRTPIWRTERGGPVLEVVARAATGVQPKSVAVSPDGETVVVCNFGRPDRDNVFLYDAALRERGRVHFAGNAVESAFSPDGATLYVSNFRRHVVEEIDLASREVRREIAVGTNPKTIALSPDGRTMYVANYFDRSVSVVDLDAGEELRRLPTGERPRGLGVMADGALVAAAFHGDTLHHFRPGAGEEHARWEACRYPRDVLPRPDGHGFALTCSLGRVGFYRLDGGGRPFGLAPTGRNPRSIDQSADGRWLGVANFTSSDVTLVDTVERTHRRLRVPGASRLVGLAMGPGPAPRVYATSWDTAEVVLLAEPDAGR